MPATKATGEREGGGGLSPLLLYSLRKVTEAAAIGAHDWIGRGRKEDADGAAAHALRQALMALPIEGRIVVGEDPAGLAPSAAPELGKGQQLGSGGSEVDLAIDPLEGTSYLAKGQTNAMAVVAVTPRGAMFDPGPAYYMEKFVASAAAQDTIEPDMPVATKIARLAQALSKPVSEISIYVLEKPRHRELIAAIHAAGARVQLYPAGDVAGAIMAALPDSGIDALMGTGGTHEGVIAACAVRALGGIFFGRIDPQLATERHRVGAAGMDLRRWWSVDELVATDEAFFCATGITTGLLFEGVERDGHGYRTQTLMISGKTGERHLLTSWLPAAEARRH